jgi:hypothetical protein
MAAHFWDADFCSDWVTLPSKFCPASLLESQKELTRGSRHAFTPIDSSAGFLQSKNQSTSFCKGMSDENWRGG